MKKKAIFPLLILFISLILGAISYLRISQNLLNIWTGLLFLSALGISLLFISEFVMRVSKRSTNSINNIRVLIISINISLIGVELFLRYIVNAYSVYPEINYSSYSSNYTFSPGHYYLEFRQRYLM